MPEWKAGFYCRACAAELQRARRARYPEKVRAADRARYRALTPEQRERRRQRAHEKYEEKRRERAEGRRCVECDGPIPVEFIVTRLTCSDACRRVRNNRKARAFYYRKTGGAPRASDEAGRRRSEAKKKWWADGPNFKPRECRGCGRTYSPRSPQQRYCNEECWRASAAANGHGVSAADLRAMLEKQSGRCAICGAEKRGWAAGNRRRRDHLVIDHCHNTGKVRGLLCGDCNTAIGRFGDDPERLRAAARYLDTAL